MRLLHRIFLVVLLNLAFAGRVAAQVWEARFQMTHAGFQSRFDAMNPRGFYPAEITALEVNGEVRYDAVWVKEPTVSWQAVYEATSERITETFAELRPQGFVPTVLTGYSTSSGTRFAAVWRMEPGVVYRARWNVDAANLQRFAEEFASQGFVPASISGYNTPDGQTRYATIWRRRTGVTWESRSDLTAEEYQAWFDRLTPQGYVPVDISVYRVNGEVRFAAIWERVSGTAWEARHNQSFDEFLSFSREHVNGYAPYAIAAYASGSGVRYAGAWRFIARPTVTVDSAATRNLERVPPGTRSARLDVTPVYQQTQVWCWLAVGEMLFRHYGIPNDLGGSFQCGIVRRISEPGSPCASSCSQCVRPSGSNYGTLSMITNYAQMVAGRRFEYSEARVISPAEIVENIDARRPILAGISTTRRVSNADSEHVVLVVGYDFSGGTMHLIVNDPFPYPTSGNPYFRYGATQVQPYQYRVAYDRFRDGLFWHWSVFNISL